jgi:MraZ protein
MFSGCYIHSVDEKSRISLPARLRDALVDNFVLTKGPDGCLWALPMDQWQLIVAKAAKSVDVHRFFIASSAKCSLGVKGRFLLPINLRKHADIKPGEEVVIVGLPNRIEIWSARKWESINSQLTTERVQQELPEFFNL